MLGDGGGHETDSQGGRHCDGPLFHGPYPRHIRAKVACDLDARVHASGGCAVTIAVRILSLLFLSTGAFAAPTGAAEAPPYPVWWSPELELDSLEAVEARLRRDLWPDFPEGMKLYKRQGEGHVTAQARNCESLSRLSEDGYYGGGSHSIFVQNYQLSRCRAIAMLGRARPARVSHLRDFVLNEDAVNILPALVNSYVSCQFRCYAYVANKRGISLRDFDQIEHLEVTGENSLIVRTVGWQIEMTILARGDFTSDGLDDILLLSSGGATEGTMGTARLFVLTRDRPGAVLKALDAERELCPGYGCG